MIEIEGQRTLDRPREEAWRLLMDPGTLRAAIPGCEEFAAVGPRRYRMAFKGGLGHLRGRFEGEAWLEDVVEPERYRLAIRVKGKLGWIDGTTDVRLAPGESDLHCQVSYALKARVGGLIAAGARLLPAAARSWVEEFFEQLGRPA